MCVAAAAAAFQFYKYTSSLHVFNQYKKKKKKKNQHPEKAKEKGENVPSPFGEICFLFSGSVYVCVKKRSKRRGGVFLCGGAYDLEQKFRRRGEGKSNKR